MRRSAALVSLSRDHHQALAVALKLRRATAESAAADRAAFLAYWSGHGRRHFRQEEELLFPAFAGHGDPHHPLVLQALGDHAAIRCAADAVAADADAAPDALHALGVQLADHVRLEERQVFPLIEDAMPAPDLAALAAALEAADGEPSPDPEPPPDGAR